MPSELYQRAAKFAMDDEDCKQITDDLRAGLMLSAAGASTLMLGASENNAGLDSDQEDVERAIAGVLACRLAKAAFDAIEMLLGCAGCAGKVMLRMTAQKVGEEASGHTEDHIGEPEGRA